MKFLFQLLLLIILQGFVACKQEIIIPPVTTDKTDFKVLFVGNSFTFYNEGVDFHLQKMLDADASKDTTVKYLIQKIAVSSYTLQAHYEDVLTLNKIKSDKWNVVVLQEQSTRPINNPALFLEYATKLDLEIKKAKAKTVLYMTWAPNESPTDINTIAASYYSVGSQISAQVAPVGRVWETIQKANPLINFYFTDNKHPSLAGTYLVSCAFYYSLFNKNPMNNTYLPTGMTTQQAAAIRLEVYDFFQ
jgi:hypothetical protein